jgi:hypothetical protein
MIIQKSTGERKRTMKKPLQLTKSTNPVRDFINRSSLRRAVLLSTFALALAWLALLPAARAVSPPPDGGYFNHNTAEGEDALFSLTTGKFNTAIGENALFSDTTGGQNTANGALALSGNTSGTANTANGAFALGSNTTGYQNTAMGAFALNANTTGKFNTATGQSALSRNITGLFNTANGDSALFNNTTANSNTANGYRALFSNTTGFSNTANGDNALSNNTTGNSNTATGYTVLHFNTTGSFNTANGMQALYFNSTGGSNIASGYAALYSNTTGSFNAANGANALQYNTTGGGNVADGGFALYVNTTGTNNVALGFDALINNTTGNSNIGIGLGAGGNLTTGNNNIDIGNAGVAGEANTIRIGTIETQTNAFVAGIYGVTVARGIGVIIDSDGHLGTTTSSARFKDAIKPMDKASEAILALKPVTFRYKEELDPEGIPQFGLIAEDVAKVNPDLVARDDRGKPYTVRYEAVNAMLLNEFLKEHRKNEKQEATIARLEKQIEALTAGLQKVSAQLELSKAASQTVLNHH